jgi:hypothetical protein
MEEFFSSTPEERLLLLQNINTCSLSSMKIISEKIVIGEKTYRGIKNYYGNNIENIYIKYDNSIVSSVKWVKQHSLFRNAKILFECNFIESAEDTQTKLFLDIKRKDGILIKDLTVFLKK